MDSNCWYLYFIFTLRQDCIQYYTHIHIYNIHATHCQSLSNSRISFFLYLNFCYLNTQKVQVCNQFFYHHKSLPFVCTFIFKNNKSKITRDSIPIPAVLELRHASCHVASFPSLLQLHLKPGASEGLGMWCPAKHVVINLDPSHTCFQERFKARIQPVTQATCKNGAEVTGTSPNYLDQFQG